MSKAKTMMTTSAVTISSSVLGTRSQITSQADWPRFISDMPKSPRRMPRRVPVVSATPSPSRSICRQSLPMSQ